MLRTPHCPKNVTLPSATRTHMIGEPQAAPGGGGGVERHNAAVCALIGYINLHRVIRANWDNWAEIMRTVIANSNILMGALTSSAQVHRIVLEAMKAAGKKRKADRESTAGIDMEEKTGIIFADR